MARPGLVFFSRSRPRVEERRRDAPAVARGDAAKVVVVKKDVGDGEVEKEARALVVATGIVGRGRRGRMDARGKEGSTKAQQAGGIDATIWLWVMAKEREARLLHGSCRGAPASASGLYAAPRLCVWVGGMRHDAVFPPSVVSAHESFLPTLLRSASLPHPCLLWVPVTTACRKKKQTCKPCVC